MSDVATAVPAEVTCPAWCVVSPCKTGQYARTPGEVLHTAECVDFAVPDGSGKPGRYPVAFMFQLGCFSETQDKPGAPFIMIGDDCCDLRDVSDLDDMITELEKALPLLRSWRGVLAAHYGEPI